MPAIKSDTAFIRVYRGNQSSTGKYFATAKRGFRSEIEIGGHSSSDILLVSMGYESGKLKNPAATTSFSRLRNRERARFLGAPVSTVRDLIVVACVYP